MELWIGKVLCGEREKMRVEWSGWRGEWFSRGERKKKKSKIKTPTRRTDMSGTRALPGKAGLLHGRASSKCRDSWLGCGNREERERWQRSSLPRPAQSTR